MNHIEIVESQAVEAAMDDTSWWFPDPGNAHYCPGCVARIRQPENSETGAGT